MCFSVYILTYIDSYRLFSTLGVELCVVEELKLPDLDFCIGSVVVNRYLLSALAFNSPFHAKL